MLKKERQVLLIINDGEVCQRIEESIHGRFGFEAEATAEGRDALGKIEGSPWQYDVAVIYDDLKKRGSTIALLKKIKKNYPEIEVIYIINSATKDTAEALHEGAFGCFCLPLDYEGIVYAIKNAREQAQSRRERKMLEKLQQLSLAINTAADLQELISVVLVGSFELFEGDVGCAMLHEDGYLRVVEGDGIPKTHDYETEVKIGDGLIGKAAQKGIPEVISNFITVDPHIPFSSDSKSALVIPLSIGEHLVGVIYLESNSENHFRAEDRLIQIFSKEAAIAIHRAQLLEEREKTKDALFSSAKSVAAGLIATGFIHEVKNRLNAIAMTVGNIGKRIQKEQDIKSKNDYIEKIDTIEKEILRVYDLSRQLQRFGQRLTAVREDAYLNEVVRNTIDLLESTIKKQKMALDLKLDPALDKCEFSWYRKPNGNLVYQGIDKGQIEQVIINLTLNAIEASNPRSHLLVETKMNEDSAEIRVTDYGKGIETEILPNIFKPFFTTKPDGVGLGLYISRLIVEDNHQGKIWIKTKPGKGTTFYVIIPLKRD